MTEEQRRPLVWIDALFGAYCLVLTVLAGHCWWTGECGPRTAVAFAVFALANGALSQLSRRSRRPAAIEAARLVVGATAAPLAYLAPEAPFDRWWPAFLIMSVGGGVMQTLTSGPRRGRLLCLYYVVLFLLVEAFGGRTPDWHAFVIDAGATAAMGLLAVELVWILERARREKGELAAIIEAAPYPVATMALDGRLEYLNPAACALAGCRRAGSSLADLYGDDRERMATGLAEAAAGRTWSGEGTFARTPVFAAFFPLPDSAGRPRRVATVLRDISARKEMEAALRRSAETFRALAESTSDVVVRYDLELRHLYVNPAIEALTGRAPERFLGRTLGELGLDAAFVEESQAAIREVIATARPRRAQMRLPRGNWIEWLLAPELGEDGAVRSVVGTARDVSASKQAEAELKEAKEAAEEALFESRRLSAVLEATSDMVCMADAAGRMVYMNRSERRLLGIGEQEDISRLSVLDQYPPESAERVRNEALPRTVTHGTWTGELERLTRDGRRIPVSLVGVALPGPDGTPAYLAAVARDITERVRLESDLRQARDAAEAANRAKSTFLANMSHEIRTPMNAVIGMTGLLLGTALDPRQRDLVETVRASGDALLTLINDILDFSKIEAGRMELDREGFDLRACVESAVDLLAPRAAEKGLALSYSMGAEVPEAIVGDEGRLRQVLVNLVGNAVKFTERGEVLVSVGREEETGALRFCVRDTGPGLSPADQARLFQPFTQLDGAATRRHGGSGLGLAISRRLTELMGGRLWAESDGPGQGSTFRFTVRAEAAPTPLRPWHRGRQPALSGRVLLVVDGGPGSRRVLGTQARTWGMSPVEAASAAEALEALRRGERFDVALLDVDLAGVHNGWELARQVRALPGAAALPLVGLCSVGTDPAAHPDARLFHAFLTKPVKPSQLYDVLVGVFVGKTGEARPASRKPAAPAPEPPLAARLPLRILLAEDVPVNQKFALLALETMGYRADVAANGLEVLQALRRQRYDVVFMDMQMPHLDGAAATRRIRTEWPAAEQPRIVAMTANALQGDRELCLEAGMDDYVSKPVYLHELRAALERCCAPA